MSEEHVAPTRPDAVDGDLVTGDRFSNGHVHSPVRPGAHVPGLTDDDGAAEEDIRRLGPFSSTDECARHRSRQLMLTAEQQDARALLSAARFPDISVVVLTPVLPSNEAQIRRGTDAVLCTHKRKVAVVGLALKRGTDHLREGPMVDIAGRANAAQPIACAISLPAGSRDAWDTADDVNVARHRGLGERDRLASWHGKHVRVVRRCRAKRT